VHSGKAMFVKAPELTNIRPVVDPSPYTKAQLDAAAKAAAKSVAATVKVAADTAAATFGA
jgi:hypothetical protein